MHITSDFVRTVSTTRRVTDGAAFESHSRVHAMFAICVAHVLAPPSVASYAASRSSYTFWPQHGVAGFGAHWTAETPRLRMEADGDVVPPAQ